MTQLSMTSAAITRSASQELALSGSWTVHGIGAIEPELDAVTVPSGTAMVIGVTHIEALDTTGAWVLQKLLSRLHGEGVSVQLQDLRPDFAKLLEIVKPQVADPTAQTAPIVTVSLSPVARLGRGSVAVFDQTIVLLSFVGESAIVMGRCIMHPSRLRWRTILYNIRSAGFDALPIVGLLALMLGIVVAYQGADQLQRYGANIFVVDLVGLSMLREFGPLITAIIIAGRSGSAYAAQIGTMSVTEEIDAMRTLGIAPLELLVLPKIIALLIVMPLLTVYADVLGVFGGMIMARAQLGVEFPEFLDRFDNAISITAYLIGICKAPVFAVIIAVVGCFQGFQTKGGADSVGRQTTRAVVQSIFFVILADGLFSIAFSALDL